MRPMRRSAVFLLAFCVLAGAAAAGRLGEGDRLPELVVESWTGGPVAFSALRGTVVVVDFWASWCDVCRNALPELDRIARRHSGKGLEVLAVSVDQDRGAAERFLSRYLPDPAVTLGHDPGGDVLARFGAAAMPALYLVDREGIVRRVETGYSRERLAGIEEEIGRLLGAGSKEPPAR